MLAACRENSTSILDFYLGILRRIRHRSIIEGIQGSLQRLQLDYVDVVFAHRPDSSGTTATD